MKPKTLILKTAGINCDVELAHGFQIAGSDVETVHINELARGEKSLLDYDILGFPGGFSYGDDLSAGRVLATEVLAHLTGQLIEFYHSGGLIIGICNGFQTLVKAGILPDPANIGSESSASSQATLFWNDSGKFEDRWITLKVENTNCVWTRWLPEIIEFPVAHAEGKFIPASDEVLLALENNSQIVFRYCDPASPEALRFEDVPYPLNPNGSTANIAGICDPTGRVLGLMPHPERFLYPENHPRWNRLTQDAYEGKPLSVVGDDEFGTWAHGFPLFKAAVEYVISNKGIRASR